jgi:hypothetical protein
MINLNLFDGLFSVFHVVSNCLLLIFSYLIVAIHVGQFPIELIDLFATKAYVAKRIKLVVFIEFLGYSWVMLEVLLGLVEVGTSERITGN